MKKGKTLKWTAAAIAVFSLGGMQGSAKEPLIQASDTAEIRLLPGHFLLEPEYGHMNLAKGQGTVAWDVSLYGSGASHGMPFWAGANRRGLVPENLSNGQNRLLAGYGDNRGGLSGLMTAGAEFAYLTKPEIAITAGLSFAGYGVKDSWKGMLDRLYFGISWKKLHLDLGMKDRYFDYNGLSLTGGDLAYSGNARNLPGYNLSTDFIYTVAVCRLHKEHGIRNRSAAVGVPFHHRQIGAALVFQVDGAVPAGKELNVVLPGVQNVVRHRGGFHQGIDARFEALPGDGAVRPGGAVQVVPAILHLGQAEGDARQGGAI